MPEWISVDERLPEKGGDYLVYIIPEAGKLWAKTEIVHYSGLMGTISNKIFWTGDYGKQSFQKLTGFVTHWMPLPEPPEGA